MHRLRCSRKFGKLPLESDFRSGRRLRTSDLFLPAPRLSRESTKRGEMTMKALLTAAVLVALAGCSSTPSKMTDAADRLERSAENLYEEVRRDNDTSDAAREAQRLTEAADE